MSRLSPHTSCRKGKRVRAVLRNGTVLEGLFVERTGKFIVVNVDGKDMNIQGRNLKQFYIAKGEKLNLIAST